MFDDLIDIDFEFDSIGTIIVGLIVAGVAIYFLMSWIWWIPVIGGGGFLGYWFLTRNRRRSRRGSRRSYSNRRSRDDSDGGFFDDIGDFGGDGD